MNDRPIIITVAARRRSEGHRTEGCAEKANYWLLKERNKGDADERWGCSEAAAEPARRGQRTAAGRDRVNQPRSDSYCFRLNFVIFCKWTVPDGGRR